MKNSERQITEIYCPNCGAPARFDIAHQEYRCGYCGGRVQIKEALSEKQGFRELQSSRMKEAAKTHKLLHAECGGCGANVVFEENEALADCPFCGRAMVRSAFLKTDNLPEYVIPFAFTEEQAKNGLLAWCDANRARPEAKRIRKKIDQLKGFYLPYELIYGPVHLRAGRMSGMRSYRAEAYLTGAFVNASKNLNNLLLEGAEPFDKAGMKEFDFAYLAGQRLKIADITGNELTERTRQESAQLVKHEAAKVLETEAIDIRADVSEAVRLPTALPVYTLISGDLMAAVNGQTGKISVRELKESHYYFLPWWLKAILGTLGMSLLGYCGLRLFGMESGGALFLTGILGVFFLVVFLCMYSDTVHNSFSVSSGHKILTFGDDAKMDTIEGPVFFENLDGKEEPVILKFTTPLRVLRIVVLTILGLFLPVILALFLNGFDFQKLNLGGSAVWFCIAVPVVPVYVLKFAVNELHDHPWIYRINEDGSTTRYRRKIDASGISAKDIIRALFVPPVSLAVWFGIICFCVMVWLTAFGWD